MAYVQTQGYGSRLVESIKGVLFGVVLFAISFPLLWWNEGRAVQTARSLEEGATSVVSVTGLVPSNEGKLVHFSGQATTAETLADHELGVTALALRMQRNVEMYQWYEKSESHENTGGSKTTVYTYDKKWSPSLIRSTDFKESGHDNPPQMPVRRLPRMSPTSSFRIRFSGTSACNMFLPITTPLRCGIWAHVASTWMSRIGSMYKRLSRRQIRFPLT